MSERDDATRPAPERLLAEANAAERPARRGRLKVFFGAAPGVGKTYTMLEAALARVREGGDVVAGVVLTHGRVETEALLRDLPRLPAAQREHRGVALEEFDLDAALARAPALLLVDELAHTNAPGSRHVKRWQDVDELLAAGIDVYTTLNVQHVESMHDVVERLTGVPVRERVPDEFLDGADEVELVDLPVDELLARLRAGKVYLGDQAARAEANFFKPATLSGLRELALRLVADRVRATAPSSARGKASGRLLVAVSSSPFSTRLLRAARRMAESLNVEWLALHVVATEGLVQSEAEARRLGNHLRFAEQLGAEVHTATGRDLVGELVAFARRHDVRHVVVGRPLRARLRDRLQRSLVAELVDRAEGLDVFVVSGEPVEAVEASGTRVARPEAHDWVGYALAVGAIAFATALGWLLHTRLAPVNLCMVYLVAVVAMAARGRRGPAVVASLLAVASFDFLFVPPFFSFTVSDSEYVVTFVAMLLVSLLVSTQSARLRALLDAAFRRAESSTALHRLSGELASTRGLEPLVGVVRRRGREILGVPVRVLVRRDDGDALEEVGLDAATPPIAADELAVARWVVDHGEPAGRGTATLPGAAGLHLPLAGARGTVGVLVCEGIGSERLDDPEQRRLVESTARVVGLALEGERLGELAQEAAVSIRSERLKNALLSSVSHDLRTPLSVITGSATALAESQGLLDPTTRAELARAIADEAESLSRVVTNLLDVSRLEAGHVKLRTEPHAVEDLFGTALAAMQRRLVAHPTTSDVAPDCPPVAVDPVLFQSVLVNLLDNAVKYTPPGTPITLRAHGFVPPIVDDGDDRPRGPRVEIVVADRGPGLEAGELERVFEKFVRGTAHGSQRGVGLGLTICKQIVEAHGGTIRARARDGGGAEFVVTLPAVALAADAEHG